MLSVNFLTTRGITMLQTPESTRLRDAWNDLEYAFPFFGPLNLTEHVEENIHVPTLGVNAERLFFNAMFVQGTNPEILKSALAHEALHILLAHGIRRGTRHPVGWNYATDYVVNLILKNSGFLLSPLFLLSDKYPSMNAETVYDLIPPFPEDSGNVIDDNGNLITMEELREMELAEQGDNCEGLLVKAQALLVKSLDAQLSSHPESHLCDFDYEVKTALTTKPGKSTVINL
jgi:predicted metal-dependent peptidase